MRRLTISNSFCGTLLVLMIAMGLVPAISSSCEARWVWTIEKGWKDPDPDDVGTPEHLLGQCNLAFRAQAHEAALEGYERLIRIHPLAPEAKVAVHRRLDCLVNLKQYEDALDTIEAILESETDQQAYDHAVATKFKVGMAYITGAKLSMLWWEYSGVSHGEEILRGFVSTYPYRPESDDALFHIGNYYFGEKQYEDAADVYERLIRDYPKSEWAGLAEYQLGECAFRKVKGVEYDLAPLVEAESRFRRYLSGGFGGDRQDRARQRLVEIRRYRAERKYRVAEFYIKDRRPRVAERYLKDLIKDFSDTDAARRARKLLDMLPGRRSGGPSTDRGGSS